MTGPILALAAMAATLPATSGSRVSPADRQQDTRVETAYGCVVCHADKRRAFILGVHSERGIRCHDCHGGNPAAFETPAAHRGGFIGSPGKLKTVELCASCHSDIDQMRQYGLPADQLAEFRTSRHGRLLLQQRNVDAPTCTDCHDAHTILRPDDARSNVYPTNISVTCARCHEDDQLMSKYGIPTDQLERYRESVHGVELFDGQNFAAPSCIGCHGSHAAQPPGVTEIVNVCSRCHVLLGRAFEQGPHGPAARAGRLPGCLACHSNHGTERVPPDQIASVCANCHDSNSRAASVGVEIQERVIEAMGDLDGAARAIRKLVLMGRDVADERFRYQTALTYYRQIGHVQHNLDLELLEDMVRRVRSNTGIIRATGEARAEARWEHKLLLVPVWFLTLAAIALAWFKLRELNGSER